MKRWQDGLIRLWQKYKYFMVVILAGILLLTISVPEKRETKTDTETGACFDLEAFQKNMAERLSQIEGAGRVEVMLSLESGEESVFASDVNRSSRFSEQDSSESYQSETAVVSDGSYGETPILIKNNYPVFRGAVIICEGADNSQVRLAITNAVTALCGISSDHVSISKMSS